MKFADHLSKEQRQQLEKLKSSKKRKKKEHLSRREWVDIMGMKRQTYYKKNGAWHGR
jgi:hypothetical protein